MDDRQDGQAAMQQQGGRTQGIGQGSGSIRSTSPASTLILEWGRSDSLHSGDGGHVDSHPQGPESQGESMDIDDPDHEPAEDPVLRAWFNVVARVGEIVGPDMRVVIRDPHAFMTCMMMTGLFSQQGLVAPVLAGYTGEAAENERVPAVSVMSEAGRVVSFTCNMRTGVGIVSHPRGRVSFENPNDLWVQVTHRIIGPAVRLARERDSWHLRRDGVPVEHEQLGDEPGAQEWPLEGDDREAKDFLRTQHMIAADDELEDKEALAFIQSHQNSVAVQTASARQVTVFRDLAGTLQSIRGSHHSRHQVNYSTNNQDDELGRWAAVDPFSAAGARAALDAILLPSLWSQKGPVRLEIAPMRSNLPGMLTMQRGMVFDPWSAEGLRAAFRLIQAVARGRYQHINGSTSAHKAGLNQPAITIIITKGRD